MSTRPDLDQIEADDLTARRLERDRHREPSPPRHPRCIGTPSTEPPARHPRSIVPDHRAARGAFQASVIDGVNRSGGYTLRADCPRCHGPVFVPANSDRELVTCAACEVELTTKRTIDGVDLVQRDPQPDGAP